MTIAAGFVYSDGVLLCCDSQVETWDTKGYSPIKIRSLAADSFTFGYVMAGNVSLAAAAIDKAHHAIIYTPGTPPDPLRVVERILAEQYRSNVLSHPSYGDPNLPYSILMAYRHEARVTLYATVETALVECHSYQFAGIGQSLGQHLLAAPYLPNANEEHALLLASHILETLKRKVPGCGGGSHFMVIRKDGSHADLSGDIAAVHVEVKTDLYRLICEQLFLSHAKRSTTDEQFENKLSDFVRELRGMREEWKTVQANTGGALWGSKARSG